MVRFFESSVAGKNERGRNEFTFCYSVVQTLIYGYISRAYAVKTGEYTATYLVVVIHHFFRKKSGKGLVGMCASSLHTRVTLLADTR